MPLVSLVVSLVSAKGVRVCGVPFKTPLFLCTFISHILGCLFLLLLLFGSLSIVSFIVKSRWLMMSTHKHILVYISSSVTLFGLFWICIFGDWHTVNALGDDASIYLVDFDETAYDLYLKGYYPSDYTYADFRRDSIESMTSHYVATDSNNFTAIVDTIENDVLQNGWSIIDNFFEDAWINLKSGDITVVKGFTDDFKHTLDGRFKITPPATEIVINGHTWLQVSFPYYVDFSPYNVTVSEFKTLNSGGNFSGDVSGSVYVTRIGNSTGVCSWVAYNSSSATALFGRGNNSNYISNVGGRFSVDGVNYLCGQVSSRYPSGISSQYSDFAAARSDFYGNFDSATGGGEPYWSGDGYYSDTPTDYNINLPALPAINWPSISTNNKTKYGVNFPDIDLTVDFQLPDSYYPQSVTYDTPYWLYNTDSTPVDWANVSFEDVTLPDVQLTDGDGSFFQALFNTLPLAFVPIFLGVILCYLIFLML